MPASVRPDGRRLSGGAQFTIDSRNSLHFQIGDVLVVAPLARHRACTLVQMSGLGAAPANTLLLNAGTSYRYNPAAWRKAIAKNVTLSTTSAGRTCCISTPGRAERRAAAAPPTWPAPSVPVSVADNIVSIKGQYGFDTRVVAGTYDPNPTGNGMQITAWSADHDRRRQRRRGGRPRRLPAHRRRAACGGGAQQDVEKPAPAASAAPPRWLPTVFAAWRRPRSKPCPCR
jgi:type IV pilus assembly protein PilW